MSKSIMFENKSNRIGRNTFVLYFRMLVSISITFYTSRILLQTLGIRDFGIFNVVGGIVTFFTVLNSSLTKTTQRFFNVKLGKSELVSLKDVFSTSINIHLFIAFFVLVFSETVGFWFLNSKMDIPAERIYAANWVYQFAVISTILIVISIPYNALIIAHERMGIFAFISLIDVFAKLIVVYLTLMISEDKLITYSSLACIVQFTDVVLYYVFCKRFPEARYRFSFNKELFKQMFSFVGWTSFSSFSYIGCTQGLNILLNIYFGPIVNAARAIAVQVQSAISGFCNNLQMAISPQITKSFAVNDLDYMRRLVLVSSRYSFFLFFIPALPILFETDAILTCWLTSVPPHSESFIRIMFMISFIDVLANPITQSALAIGRVRKYFVIEGSILLMVLPLSFVLLCVRALPEMVFYVHLFLSFAAQIAKLIIILPIINLSAKEYFLNVVYKIMRVSFFSSTVPFVLHLVLRESLVSLVVICAASIIASLLSVWIFGTEREERLFISKGIGMIQRDMRSKFSINFLNKVRL